MKRHLYTVAMAVVLLFLIPLHTLAAEMLVPVGKIIGLQLHDDTVTIAAFDDAYGQHAREAGLQIGDEILSIDGCSIDCAEDVRKALEQCDGQITLSILRSNKKKSIQLTPVRTDAGSRLGVYLKQGIAGIGTVTFYDPESGIFGTLGHGVSDNKGTLLKLTGGSAYEAEILSVKRGQCGDPGALKGSAEAMRECGKLLRNTPQGVFGISTAGWRGEPLPVADYSEIQTGEATIRSTVQGDSPREYSVEILKIYPEDRPDHRNFLIKVTDPELLNTTGGIVQGMSGSPIIQDGKLVGAVTHVLVNDPTKGYGIFIENMLDAAG